MKKLKCVILDFYLNSIVSSSLFPSKVRMILYGVLGHKIKGEIQSGTFMGYGKGKLYLGKGSSINHHCFLDLGDDIVIEENVRIAFNVTFVNSYHLIGDASCRATNSCHKSIHIEKGCWIGANVTIMPGVRVGRGCVIGTGALIVKDCEPDGLYVGVPAKRIKNLD